MYWLRWFKSNIDRDIYLIDGPLSKTYDSPNYSKVILMKKLVIAMGLIAVMVGICKNTAPLKRANSNAPVNESKPSTECDPNYSGCVPIASDVDCAGGSGNGPAYVKGPVRVIGQDIYDLDRDGDGIGCE